MEDNIIELNCDNYFYTIILKKNTILIKEVNKELDEINLIELFNNDINIYKKYIYNNKLDIVLVNGYEKDIIISRLLKIDLLKKYINKINNIIISNCNILFNKINDNIINILLNEYDLSTSLGYILFNKDSISIYVDDYYKKEVLLLLKQYLCIFKKDKVYKININ